MASASSQISDYGNNTSTQTDNNTLMSYGGNGGVTSSSTTIFGSNSTSSTGTDMLPNMKPLKKTLNLEEIEKLPYEIHRYSSFSTNYVPE